MELATAKRNVICAENFFRFEQKISAENVGHIASILSDKLYSDKILAVCREYICNATDAHVECGKPDLAVDIHCPTNFNPVFRVRDYGIGITESEMESIYVNLGDSTKRSSNSQIGAFGIGNMSFRAYTDSMLVTSWKNGQKTVYSLQVGDNNCVSSYILSSERSSEPSGLMIEISVNNRDIYEFVNKIKFLAKHMRVKPNVENISEIEEISYKIKFDTWGILDSGRGVSYVQMGDVPYVFDTKKLEDLSTEEKKLLYNGIIIHVNIGDVDITPSREGLEWTNRTIKFMYQKVKEAFVELNKWAQKELDSINDYREFVIKSQEYSNIKGISLEEIKFKGSKIYKTLKSVEEKDANGVNQIVFYGEVYSPSITGHKIRGSKDKTLQINEYSCVVIQDTSRAGITQRLKTIENEKGIRHFYVVDPSRANYDKFKNAYQLETWASHCYKLSDFEKTKSARTGTYRGPESRAHIDVFKFNGYGGWTAAEDIPDDDIKYYAPINRFKIETSEYQKENASELSNISSYFDAIYGVRTADTKKLDDTWVNLLDELKNNWKKYLLSEKNTKGIINSEIRVYSPSYDTVKILLKLDVEQFPLVNTFREISGGYGSPNVEFFYYRFRIMPENEYVKEKEKIIEGNPLARFVKCCDKELAMLKTIKEYALQEYAKEDLKHYLAMKENKLKRMFDIEELKGYTN